jgi:O-antigen biosynthesis protein
MVTYGARAWVEQSIAALRRHTDVPHQLVVVDNASPDDTTAWLRTAVAADELVALDRNVGFAAGNDLGANLARAPYVCFVNSDAVVPAGWARRLLEPFADESVAATVPLYVDADRVVQEAGCNIDDRADVTPLSRGDDPDADEQRWPRAVQHASAACLVVRTSAFRAVGGFDAGYGLAYYEDVELVAALQARGGRVVLVPSVHVVHAHAASTPDRAAADARVAANRPRFVARHATYLAGRHHAHDLQRQRHRYYAARDFETPDRALVVVDRMPEPSERLPGAPDHHDPGTRVTLLLRGPASDDDVRRAAAWRAAAVEVLLAPHGVDLAEVLDERFLQLSTIVASGSCLTTFRDVLDATQPQAVRVASSLR